MTPTPHSPATATRRPTPPAEADHEAQPRPGAVLLSFPPHGGRRRRAPRSGEARGEILFFLGVRYERLAS